MPLRTAAVIAACVLLVSLAGRLFAHAAREPAVPRTADGKPNLQGVWQVRNTAAFGLEDHVARARHAGRPQRRRGRTIPYLPEAAAKQRLENASNPKTADPLEKCYMPGVPRIMYMPFPFHIYQTPDHIAITFEWSQVHRTIYTNGVPGPEGIDFWMGDSRGRWEGDTLVVDVKDHNDQTWFDTTGTFHSDALHVVERYTMTDADTIQYEATIEDPKVFSKTVEDRDADLPAQGSRSHPRVSVPGGARGSQRRLRARSQDVVSGTRRRSPWRFLRTGRR